MGRLDAARFRKFHQDVGEKIRWLKAIPVPVGTAGRGRDGVKLIEQSIPTQARFPIATTTEDYESADFGIIARGTMQIAAFPDWARFSHLDRVVLLAVGRQLSQRERITRGAGMSDILRMPHVANLVDVWVNGVAVNGADYQLQNDAIKWLNNAPSLNAEYAVEYRYHPTFIVLPQNHRTSPTDKRGNSLPLHYWLQRERTGER